MLRAAWSRTHQLPSAALAVCSSHLWALWCVSRARDRAPRVLPTHPACAGCVGACVQPLCLARRWSRGPPLSQLAANSLHSVTPSLAATGQTPTTWHRGFAAGAKAAVAKPPRVTAAAAAAVEAEEAAEAVRLPIPTASSDSLAQLAAPDVGRFFRLSQQVCARTRPWCCVSLSSDLVFGPTGRRSPPA